MANKRNKNNNKIKIKQTASFTPTIRKSNVGNIGHPTLLANCGNIKVKIRRKV